MEREQDGLFLWILRMCLPLNQLKQRLNEPGVMLELSTAKDLLMKAVGSQRVRDQLLADLQWYFHAPQACMSPATRSTEAANMAPPAKSPPKATEIGWVPLDACSLHADGRLEREPRCRCERR